VFFEQSFRISDFSNLSSHSRYSQSVALKLQRGCHTLATFFATCNAYNNKQDGGRILKSPARGERWALIGPFWQNCVARGMLHTSNLSRNVAKSRGSIYFSCNSQRNNCSCEMGCYTKQFFLQLAMQRLLHHAEQTRGRVVVFLPLC